MGADGEPLQHLDTYIKRKRVQKKKGDHDQNPLKRKKKKKKT